MFYSKTLQAKYMNYNYKQLPHHYYTNSNFSFCCYRMAELDSTVSYLKGNEVCYSSMLYRIHLMGRHLGEFFSVGFMGSNKELGSEINYY